MSPPSPRALARRALNWGPDEHERRLRRDRERFLDSADGVSPLAGVETEHGLFCIDTADRHIGRALFVRRRYGDKQVLVPARILAGLGGARGGVFVDVGAHVGITTVVALRSGGFERALALEPDPGNFSLLEANVELSDLSGRVRTLRTAASDAPGVLRLAVTPRRSGEHHVLGNGELPRHADATVVEVPAEPLDSLVEAAGIAPADIGLLKVDAEGHEPAVLAGAAALTGAGVPIVLEVVPETLAAAGRLDELLALAAGSYTHVYDIRGGANRERALRGEELPEAIGADRLPELVDRYAGHFTDILLVRV